MRWIVVILLSLQGAVFAADFDYVVVGSSPFSLFEALYKAYTGHRVLIFEQAEQLGGAWKGVDVCGLEHIDLGCHQIGHDSQLQTFLQEYGGCRIVSLDNPLLPFDPPKSPNGYYFSRGCFELIDNLKKLIQKTDIVILAGQKLESISVDTVEKTATVKSNGVQFTTNKFILTPMSSFQINNFPEINANQHGKSRYFHLYVLIQDPTPPRFCYQAGGFLGLSRFMNLTHFANIADTGRQILVFQTYSENELKNGQRFIDELKNKKLIDASAYILREEALIYEQTPLIHSTLSKFGPLQGEMFEMLNTGHIQGLSTYIHKWKRALKPFHEMLPNG